MTDATAFAQVTRAEWTAMEPERKHHFVRLAKKELKEMKKVCAK